MSQLFVGLYAEGYTDYQFLKPVVEKALTELVYDLVPQEVEILVFEVYVDHGDTFVDRVISASQKGFEDFGIMALIVHSDADSLDDRGCFEYKMEPALESIKTSVNANLCREVVPVVPIYETESWMLANKDILKKFLNTNKTDAQLNIDGHPETISRPKERIEEAIRIAKAHLPKKIRNNLAISDLYSIMGDTLETRDFGYLRSYQTFSDKLRDLLVNLGYIH
jgi:hypothetical protein